MHNFCHFSPVLWLYRRHVIYRSIFYTIMQHYMPIKLWTVIVAKMVVHETKTANMRRYIAADCTMLHNVVKFQHIMLHNLASGGEKVWLEMSEVVSAAGVYPLRIDDAFISTPTVSHSYNGDGGKAGTSCLGVGMGDARWGASEMLNCG